MDQEIRGTNLEVIERRGGGETVVFVHGSLSDHRTWEKQLALLDGRYRGIAYSRRYHWPNHPPNLGDDAQYQMRDHVDDLAALIRALGGGPLHLVGNSWGAFTALVLAIREPSLVKSLVLEEPPAIPLFLRTPPGPADVLAMLLRAPRTGTAILKFVATTLAPAARLYSRGEDEQAMMRFVSGALGPATLARLPETRKQQMRDNVPAHKAEMRAEGGFAAISDAEVASVSAPALLICGDRTPHLFRLICDRLQRHLRAVERVTVPNASHMMHEEQPEATAKAINDFLGRH